MEYQVQKIKDNVVNLDAKALNESSKFNHNLNEIRNEVHIGLKKKLGTYGKTF